MAKKEIKKLLDAKLIISISLIIGLFLGIFIYPMFLSESNIRLIFDKADGLSCESNTIGEAIRGSLSNTLHYQRGDWYWDCQEVNSGRTCDCILRFIFTP